MAKKSLIAKQKRAPKYRSGLITGATDAADQEAYYRKFGLCRICLRQMAHEGKIPGLTKSSW